MTSLVQGQCLTFQRLNSWSCFYWCNIVVVVVAVADDDGVIVVAGVVEVFVKACVSWFLIL